MDEHEYKKLIEALLSKLKKGTLNNKEKGYNEGILTAVSMLRSQYKSK